MKIKTFQIVLLLTAITSAACVPRFFDQYEPFTLTSDSDIRSGPGQQYERITTAKAGSEVLLLELLDDWYKVRLSNGRIGWIFLGKSKTTAVPKKVVVSQDARIRRGPGEEYEAYDIAPKGRALDVSGQQGNWYFIVLPNGQTGWITKDDFKKKIGLDLTSTTRTEDQQIYEPNYERIPTVEASTDLPRQEEKRDYYIDQLPDRDTGRIQEVSTDQIQEGTLVVRERSEIKRGPSVQYQTLETVEQGTRLTLISQKGDWYQVRTPGGTTGWIYQGSIVQSQTIQETFVEEVPTYFITNTECNIRQGDGTNYPVLATVKTGTILAKIGQKGEWYRVRMPDQRTGWIREDMVVYNPFILITIDNGNIRLGPSTDFRVKTTVGKGIPLAKISEQDNWSKIYLPNGEDGWIHNDLCVNIDRALFVNEECNVRDGPDTKYQQIDRLPAGTPVIEIAKEGEWYKVQLPSKKIGWIRQDLLRDYPNQMVTNDLVNLRMGPGTVFQVLTQLNTNTPVNVIEEQDNWCQVKLSDGTTGWIRKDMISFSYYPLSSEGQALYDTNGSYESYSVPKVTLPENFQPTYKYFSDPATQKVKITTTSAVNLRLGPSINDSIIKTLPAGTQVIQIDRRGEWYEVQTNDGVLGYVHESGFAAGDSKLYTTKSSNIRNGPGMEYLVMTTLPEKTELKKIEQRGDWINVQTANGEKAWIHKDLVTGSKVPSPLIPQVTEPVSGSLITISDAKILQGPDNKNPTIKLVKINTELISISQYRDWYEVETFDGIKGWISRKFVSEKINKKIIVTQRTEVRESSSTQSGIIKTVEVGEFFTPLGQAEGWYRIPIKPGMGGYISARDVADLKYPEVYVNTTTADVRKFADEKATRLAIVKEGVQLTPVDESGEWLFVELPRGDKGWIKKQQVDRQKYPRIKIVKDTQAFEQPTAGSLLKATLTKDDQFLALDSKNNWFKILLRGSVIAWVYSGHVKEITKGSLLIKEKSYLRMGPGLNYRILASVPGGEKVKWLDQKGNWNQIQVSSGEIGWISEALAKNVTMPDMAAQKNYPVYAGPGTNFTKVGEIIRGKKYTPIDKKNDWYQIELYTGTTGWVPMEAFSVQKSRVVFTLDKASIQSGPGEQYTTIQTVQPASDVTVLGTEGNYYYVQLPDGKRGYIKKDLVFEENR